MAGMIKLQSRAGSANVMVSARSRGAGSKGVVHGGAGCKGPVRGGLGPKATGPKATVRKSPVRLVVPLIVPLAGVATCLAACSSTSSGTKPASPAVHETKSGKSMSSVSTNSHMSASPTASASPTGSPSISAVACEHVRALRQDLISVTHIKFNGSTAKVVVADLNDISRHLTALKNEPALAAEVGPLTGAITNVQGAIKAVSTPPTAVQLKNVVTAFNNMKVIASPMIPKLKAACL